MIENTHTILFFRLIHEVTKKISDFNDINIHSFLFNLENEIEYSKIDKSFINFDSILDPESYGWTSDIELPPLGWISAAISSHLINYKLSYNEINRLLRAIIYLGLYGLLEIFKIFETVNVIEMAPEEQFNYYRLMAKYNKEQGKFETSQDYYRKTIKIAKEINKLPYAYILLSKFYSDYLQRDGLCLEYSQIAYKQLRKNKNENRQDSICLDTYAKEVHKTNPLVSKKIYKNLLKNKDSIHPLSFRRIQFRILEIEIEDSIRTQEIKKLSYQLNKFEQLIESIEKNPRAKYIRKIIFVRLVRLIIENIDYNELTPRLKNKLKEIKEYKEEILKDCIAKAHKYKDRKNISLAYYEQSFWSTGDINNRRAIKSLQDGLAGLSLFNNTNDKKSFLNKIYIKILLRISELYVKNQEWEEALKYYQELYDYMSFLRDELEKDKDNIFNAEKQNKKEREHSFSEFENLNEKEFFSLERSLLIDYESLTKILVDLNNNIKNVRELQLISTSQIVEASKSLINHDLNNAITYIENEIKTSNSSLPNIEKIESGIKKAKSVIGEALKLDIVKSTYQDQIIDLNSIINPYIELLRYHNRGITIELDIKKKLKAIIPPGYLRQLLLNLIENSREVGNRNRVESIQIKIKCIELDRMVKIFYSDNAKDYNFFVQIIEKLNSSDLEIPSRKNPEKGGEGLKNLKLLFNKYNESQPWKLEGDNVEKTLIIPLAHSKR